MKKLKTLKELELYQCLEDYPRFDLPMDELTICVKDLRKEAIKWIKEDIKLVEGNPLLKIEKKIAERFIKRWVVRFNIIEDDLSEEIK